MVFASLEFLTLFLPAFLALYFATPRGWRNATLLAGSWLFYAWWSPKFLLLIVALTLVAWAAAIAIESAPSERTRTRLMAAAIAANVASLVWYKYTNVVVRSLNDVFSDGRAPLIAWEPVLLPIALSFTVLHAISYVVDVRRGVVPAQRGLVAFSAYMAMFPHLIAGPIVRYRVIHRELVERSFRVADFAEGARRFMLGFSMKVLVADPLAPLVALVFGQAAPSLADAWIGCGAYALQLFFDFAGYSAMAIGLGLMLGFRFEENFNHPYLAATIQDFWRRWHMTLSSWLRDYLYIPLGGNRLGEWRTYANLVATMAIGGMWHGGDSWNFLAWGLIHGAALAIARAWSGAGLAMPALAARALTLLVVLLAWTVFRAEGFAAAVRMWQGQFGAHGIAMGDAVALALRPVTWAALGLGLACVLVPATPLARLATGPRFAAWRASWPFPVFGYAVAVLAGQKSIPFLYFQF
ncbi:MAG: MBOAT family protein [Betaproteobacteria bacterium]|nr:MBOAT family protein [Betaproteobacteria bacterium]